MGLIEPVMVYGLGRPLYRFALANMQVEGSVVNCRAQLLGSRARLPNVLCPFHPDHMLRKQIENHDSCYGKVVT